MTTVHLDQITLNKMCISKPLEQKQWAIQSYKMSFYVNK